MILGGRRASDKEFRAPIAAILVCKQHAENVLGGKGNSTCSFFIGRGGSVFGRGYALRSLELAEGFAGDPEAGWRFLRDRQSRAGIQPSNRQWPHRWSPPGPSSSGLLPYAQSIAGDHARAKSAQSFPCPWPRHREAIRARALLPPEVSPQIRSCESK